MLPCGVSLVLSSSNRPRFLGCWSHRGQKVALSGWSSPEDDVAWPGSSQTVLAFLLPTLWVWSHREGSDHSPPLGNQQPPVRLYFHSLWAALRSSVGEIAGAALAWGAACHVLGLLSTPIYVQLNKVLYA